MEGVHFFQRMFGRPMIESDAVSRNKYAGAIATEPTVNKDGAFGTLSDDGEKFRHPLVCRRRPAGSWNEHEMHAQRFGLLFFLSTRMTEFTTEIHNGGDA